MIHFQKFIEILRPQVLFLNIRRPYYDLKDKLEVFDILLLRFIAKMKLF